MNADEAATSTRTESRADESADPNAPAATTTDPKAEDSQAADQKIVEVEERLLRALADLDNLRKRFDREVTRERLVERGRVAAAWLPVVDDLERALQHAAADEGSVLEGVRAVREHALSVLERLGFPRFEDVGKPFDPARHEAVSTAEAPDPPGTVVAATRPGYGTDEEILRPASVIVSRAAG